MGKCPQSSNAVIFNIYILKGVFEVLPLSRFLSLFPESDCMPHAPHSSQSPKGSGQVQFSQEQVCYLPFLRHKPATQPKNSVTASSPEHTCIDK